MRLTLTILVLGRVVLLPGIAAGQGSQYALRFYGTGVNQQDRVRIAIDDDAPGLDASTPLDVGAGSFTIEFWMRGTLANNQSSNAGGDLETFNDNWIDGDIIIDRDIWGGSERKFGISVAGGFIRFGTSSGDSPTNDTVSTIEGDALVLDDEWHHVACVRDAATGRKRIHIDGVLDYAGLAGLSSSDLSYPDDGVPTQNTPWGPYLVLAAEKHDAGPAFPSFAGYLDELCVWSVARTATEIAASMNGIVPPDAPGLVGQYRFEEGTGTTVLDSSAAGSPPGQLIAGTPGNGEWVSYAVDPRQTAPVQGPGNLVAIDLVTAPSGLPVMVNGVLLATPRTLSLLEGSSLQLEAPAASALGAQAYAFAWWSHGASRGHTFTVESPRTLQAIYRRSSQGAVQVAVEASDRNADYYPPVGQGSGNLYDPLGLCCGADSGGVFEAGLQFALPIAPGTVIDSAVLRLTATSDQQGSPSATLRAYDVADAPPFVAGSPTPLTGHAPLTTVNVAWDIPPFTPGSNYASPDLTALVQAVIDRADWQAGNHLGIVLDPAGTAPSQWRCFGNFLSGQPAELDVTYGSDPPAGEFVHVGAGLPGSAGTPLLAGSGDLTPGGADGFVLALTQVEPGQRSFWLVGWTEVDLPLFGGNLYVLPFFAIVPMGSASAAGTVILAASMDPASPPGARILLQAWIPDPAGPAGFAASNGLRLEVP